MSWLKKLRYSWILLTVTLVAILSVRFSSHNPATPEDDYLLLFVWEMNNRIGETWTSGNREGSGRDAAARMWGESDFPFDRQGRKLYLEKNVRLPELAGEILLVYQVDGLLGAVSREYLSFASLPERLRLRAQAQPGSAGLAEGTLVLEHVNEHGVVSAAWEGDKLKLSPGESWSAAWVETPDGVQNLSGEEDWEPVMLPALQRDAGVSVLRFYNFGHWPCSGLVYR